MTQGVWTKPTSASIWKLIASACGADAAVQECVTPCMSMYGPLERLSQTEAGFVVDHTLKYIAQIMRRSLRQNDQHASRRKNSINDDA